MSERTVRIHVKDDPSGYRMTPVLGETAIGELVVTAFQGDLGDDKRPFFVVTHVPSGCCVGWMGFDSVGEAQDAVAKVKTAAPHIDWSKRHNRRQAGQVRDQWIAAAEDAGGYHLVRATPTLHIGGSVDHP